MWRRAVAGLPRRRARRGRKLADRHVARHGGRALARCRLPLGVPNGDLEDLLGQGDTNVVEHAVEDLKSFQLVFEERVFLAVGAQPHRVLERAEVFQMILPAAVDGAQVLVANERVERLAADLRFLRFQRMAQFARQRLLKLPPRQALIMGGGVLGREEVTGLEAAEDRLPVAAGAMLVAVLGDQRRQLVDGSADHPLRKAVGCQDFVALDVDELALLVEDIVEIEQMLAGLEVALLDAALRAFERLVDPRMRQRLAVGKPDARDDAAHVLAEQPHQVIVEGNEEPGAAGVALPPSAAAKLIVDAARLVALGADDVEPAGPLHRVVVGVPLGELGRQCLPQCRRRPGALATRREFQVAAELDVGAAPGHVGGNRHRGGRARLRDDGGLASVILRVQHLVPNAAPQQHPR